MRNLTECLSIALGEDCVEASAREARTAWGPCQAAAAKKLPGGVFWLERNGTSYHKAYGNHAVIRVAEPMSDDTCFGGDRRRGLRVA